MPNPAHTEHHHAMNEYKRNYKLLIEENKAKLPLTILPS